jgi:hypothetical protein
MGYIVAISLVAIALLPQGVSTADFSGTWRIDLQKSLYPGDGLKDHTLEIKQTPDALTLNSADWKSPVVYKLDGTVSVQKRRTWESETRTRWEGQTLVVETKRVHYQPRQETVTTDSFFLRAPDELVSSRSVKTARGEHGFKLIYRKTTEMTCRTKPNHP